MKIRVKVKNVYGNEMIYPVCEKGKLFCEISGTKTLTRHIIDKIKKLGYEIDVMTPTINI